MSLDRIRLRDKFVVYPLIPFVIIAGIILKVIDELYWFVKLRGQK